MFREMRRKKQELTPEECDAVLYRGSSGVLALSGDDNYPYAVPLSYVYDGKKALFSLRKKRTQTGCRPPKSEGIILRD